jgi:type III restriction enzyme
MALHPDFPRLPYVLFPPDLRWFPAAEELRRTAYEKLLPPLVVKVREEVKAWRDAGYLRKRNYDARAGERRVIAFPLAKT